MGSAKNNSVGYLAPQSLLFCAYLVRETEALDSANFCYSKQVEIIFEHEKEHALCSGDRRKQKIFVLAGARRWTFDNNAPLCTWLDHQGSSAAHNLCFFRCLCVGVCLYSVK